MKDYEENMAAAGWVKDPTGYWTNPAYKTTCSHSWVTTGVPKGLVWCKTCDEDYDELRHGASGL